MSIPVVFSDTNALVAMLCFPHQPDRPSLAHEVAGAVEQETLHLLISDVVAAELRRVAARDFPKALASVEMGLELYGVTTLPEPDEGLLEQTLVVCNDPDDAPVLAAALQCTESHGVSLLLSNDIETFHTPEMKVFLADYGLAPVTLCGLLKLLGRR